MIPVGANPRVHPRSSRRAQRRRAAARGFTLTELLVAVVILLVVMLAIGRVFATVSKVTKVGQANASYLQSAPTIERQIRRDLERLTREGFFAIRNVRVRNDVNRPTPADTLIPLLDPTLAPGDYLRADQVLFFAAGVDGTRAFTGTDALDFKGGNQQATISRVYLGPAFQVPGGPQLADPVALANGNPFVPWAWEQPGNPQLSLATWPPPAAAAGVIRGAQPPATQWILARQRVLLSNDGGDPVYFNSFPGGGDPAIRNSTASIWLDSSTGDWASSATDNALRNSRVDIAAMSPAEVRQRLEYTSTGLDRPWTGAANDQRTAIADAIFYPRAEITAPSMLRADQMLVAPTLATGVVSFAVDWTYDDGVGRQVDRNGNLLWEGPGAPPPINQAYLGVVVRPDAEQPWFGLEDNARNVRPLSFAQSTWPQPWGGVFPPLAPGAFERNITFAAFPPSKVNGYEAVFGFNETTFTTTTYNPANGLYTVTYDPAAAGYTPWPNALRFTIVIADPQPEGPGRRTLQFVVRLPER